MVVKEVLNVLTPRIMTLISEALSAQQAAKQQALLEQQRQEEARRQAALLESRRPSKVRCARGWVRYGGGYTRDNWRIDGGCFTPAVRFNQ